MGEGIVLRLRRDDVPIEGRVIDLEGRPVSGLSVKLVCVIAVPQSLLASIRANDGQANPGQWEWMHNSLVPGKDGPLAPALTASDGRFRISGVGRDRLALLNIEGGAVEHKQAAVLTSSDPSFRSMILGDDTVGQWRIEPPRFELAVAPARRIEGTVRDGDNGQPIAGATIRSYSDMVATDSNGRFRFEGQPRAGHRSIQATVDGQPYVGAGRSFDDAGGVTPIRLDLVLKRGVWVEGRVIDASNGKPIEASVVYRPFRDNPSIKEYPDAACANDDMSDDVVLRTDAQGRFRIVALPGGGVLMAMTRAPGYKAVGPIDPKLEQRILTVPGTVFVGHALVPIDAPAGKTLVVPDIALRPGRTQHIRLAGPDGRPISGARVFCIRDVSLREPIGGDVVTVCHTNPGEAETVVVLHEDRSLGAAVELVGTERDPVEVVLQPTATVAGRLVDEDGRPRPGAQLALEQRLTSQGSAIRIERPGSLRTDPDGLFRIVHLVPGVSYDLAVVRPKEMNVLIRTEGYLHKGRWTVKPGEVQDWGDVTAEMHRP